MRATGEGHISSLCFRSGVDRCGRANLDRQADRIRHAAASRAERGIRQSAVSPQARRNGYRRRLRRIDARQAGGFVHARPDRKGGCRTRCARIVRGIVNGNRSQRPSSFWRKPTTKSNAIQKATSRSGSFSPIRRRSKTESRTRVSCSLPTNRKTRAITRPTRRLTAASSCRKWSRRTISCDFASARSTVRRFATRDSRSFPRKINGHYAMISRQDGENLYLMYSDMLNFWYTKQLLVEANAVLGVRAGRQLRLADRDGGRLARFEPRRGADPQILHRRLSARPHRSLARDRPPQSAAC